MNCEFGQFHRCIFLLLHSHLASNNRIFQHLTMANEESATSSATSPNVCLLVGDRFGVLDGLIKCSGEIESGCRRPFATTREYTAYSLPLRTRYYTATVEVRVFDTLDAFSTLLVAFARLRLDGRAACSFTLYRCDMFASRIRR